MTAIQFGIRILASAALVVSFALSAACRSVPIIPPSAVDVQPNQFRLDVRNTNGSLSARQAHAILAHLKASAPNGGALVRHLAVEQAVADNPLYTSNQVRILRDGEETFLAMFAAIRAAQHHIHLEYYIVEDVEYGGEHLSDLLIGKRQLGVEVAIIYDDVGSSNTPPAFFDRLKDAGVQVLQFHPLNPLKAKGRYSVNDRDHRKMLIVDGSRAIVGGVNMSHTYQSESPISGSGEGKPNDLAAQHWRDTDLDVTGPVVAELERLFLSHWPPEKLEELGDGQYFPRVDAQGSEVVRIIGSVPARSQSRYYITLLAAIESADATIWITTGYFVPTRQEREQLAAAARRGIDVRLMLPSLSDSRASLAVQHSTYDELLKAGVKIYEQDGAILHSKTIVVDHVWSVVGSSNVDHRSVLFNDEVDAVILGATTGHAFEKLFDSDLDHAHRVSIEAWRHRPLRERFRERFWSLTERLL